MSEWSAEWVGTFWRVIGPWGPGRPGYLGRAERAWYRVPPEAGNCPLEAIEWVQAHLIARELCAARGESPFITKWEVRLRQLVVQYPNRASVRF